ncbi:VCBS repeat-containing protein [Arthrobacter sp. StoSoilA2]|uniref:FG-GAP repeat domain-containing protein n=2 Tax=unclassified Arthrobacter TaxID=235627 RepID=UPI001CC464C3|nr:VCBS repeat-containing protein [Arthrobacter sp. StoSoilA2]
MRRLVMILSAVVAMTLTQPAVAAPARADDSWHNFIQLWWDWGVVYSDLVTITDEGHVIVYEGKPGWEGQGLGPGNTVVLDADALVTPGDWDGNAQADWMFRSSDGGLYLRTGIGGADAEQVGWGWDVMTAMVSPGDWNGDGASDVLARDDAGALWMYRGDGSGGWLPGRTQVGSGWNIMASIFSGRDFNADGKPDVLAVDTGGAMWLYPGNGAGGWMSRVQVGWGWQKMDLIAAPGDFDYDGHADVIARDIAGSMWLYPGNGAGSFTWTRRLLNIPTPALFG